MKIKTIFYTCVFIGIQLFVSSYALKKNFPKNAKAGIATVTQPYYYQSANVSVTIYRFDFPYKENGVMQVKECLSAAKPLWKTIEGEKFEILYDSTDFTKQELLQYKPLFVEGEETKRITGKVRNIDLTQKTVRFKYEVEKDGVKKEYEKDQRLPKDFQQQYPALEIGKQYEVEYWTENPQRAIIYLKKSISL
jgi:hypothetical protein